MFSIYTKYQQEWPRKQCSPFSMFNMHCLTVNSYHGVAISVPVFSYPVYNKTDMTQAGVPTYFFMSTEYYYSVLCI